MKKHLALIFFFSASSLVAQTQLLTMEEAVIKQRSTLAPSKLRSLSWIKNSSSYSYVELRNGLDILMSGKAEGGSSSELLNIDQLNTALVAAGISPLKSFPSFEWKNAKQFSFETAKKKLSYDISS